MAAARRGTAGTVTMPAPTASWVRGRVVQLLARPLPYSRRPLPVVDTTPDPGFFGPGSVTWEVMREPALLLGGARALMMQTAHPLVAQGAIDHSTYREDPFGRFLRTVEWVTVVTFGTTAEARRACESVNRLHGHVSGTLPPGAGTPQAPGGTPYSALDAELLRWVHASFVDTMLVTHDALVGGLRERDQDRFVREWHTVARAMLVPPDLLWRTRRDLSRYVAATVAGSAAPGPGSMRVAETILRPPLPRPALRPLWDLLTFATVGLLPTGLRSGYGLAWTPAHRAAHAALCRSLHVTRGALPRRFRISPVYDFALDRSLGRLRRAPAA